MRVVNGDGVGNMGRTGWPVILRYESGPRRADALASVGWCGPWCGDPVPRRDCGGTGHEGLTGRSVRRGIALTSLPADRRRVGVRWW
jgi:hypothetical protein